MQKPTEGSGDAQSMGTDDIMWCIDELRVPHEHIDMPHGRARQDPAYLSINPNGLAPTIEDDGFILWESNSCVRYIAALHAFGAKPDNLPRPGAHQTGTARHGGDRGRHEAV